MLFEVPRTGLSRRQRVAAFKRKHHIWTFRSRGMARRDRPWCAVISVTDTALEDIARYGMRLEQMGLLVTAETELGAIRELCARGQVWCDL